MVGEASLTPVKQNKTPAKIFQRLLELPLNLRRKSVYDRNFASFFVAFSTSFGVIMILSPRLFPAYFTCFKTGFKFSIFNIFSDILSSFLLQYPYIYIYLYIGNLSLDTFSIEDLCLINVFICSKVSSIVVSFLLMFFLSYLLH